MPWTRNEPDPLRDKRRQLEEQERLLSERMARLTQELHGGAGNGTEGKPAEPPVWRLEDDAASRIGIDPGSSRKRNLGRQTRRDMFLFFLCIGLLLVATAVFIWLWKTHLHLGSD